MQGSNFQVDNEPLLDLPIYNAPVNEQEHVIKLVDQIIDSIKSSHPELVNTHEKQIDSLVYKLYELTGEEIKIIDG